MRRDMKQEAEKIVDEWVGKMTYTVATRNLEEHMGLISKSLKLFGLPSDEVVDYVGWRNRRKYEFTQGLLQSVTYRDIEVLDADKDQITVDYWEILRGTQGERYEIQKEAVLMKEPDKVWRLMTEQIKQVKPA